MFRCLPTILVLCLALAGTASAASPSLTAVTGDVLWSDGSTSTPVLAGRPLDGSGTLTVPRDGLVRMALPGGGSAVLAGGSRLECDGGGLDLRLREGALLVEAGLGVAVRLVRVAFGGAWVQAQDRCRFSVMVSPGREREGLIVLGGAVRLLGKTVDKLLAAGTRSVWDAAGLRTLEGSVDGVLAWWAARGVNPEPSRAPRESGTYGAAFPAPSSSSSSFSPSLRSPTASVGGLSTSIARRPGSGSSPGDDAEPLLGLIGGVAGEALAWPLAVAGLLTLVTVLGGLILLLAGPRRSRGPSRPPSDSLLGALGLVPRCPRCNGRIESGELLAVPVAADPDAARAALEPTGTAIPAALWEDVQSELRSLRLLGRTDAVVSLSWRRCGTCQRQTYHLGAGGRTVAEYDADAVRPERSRASSRLATFVADYDPYRA